MSKAAPVESIYNDARTAYAAIDPHVPTFSTDIDFAMVVASAFFQTDQISPPDAEVLAELDPDVRDNLQETLPRIRVLADRGDEASLNLAFCTGRLLGETFVSANSILPRIHIDNGNIDFDGEHIEHEMTNRLVTEFGMGIVGFYTHSRIAQDGAYAVVAMQKSLGETVALRGLASFYGLSDEHMHIVDGGIQKIIDQRRQSKQNKESDLLIASRVHSAGRELSYGIRQVSSLLRAGELLIARGPQSRVRTPHGTKGIGYDEVLQQVTGDAHMTVITNKSVPMNIPGPGHVFELDRIIVAERTS